MRYVEELIANVRTEESGVDGLLDVRDALRLVRIRNYRALSERLNEEGITRGEARRLRAAVYQASRNHFDPHRRLALLLICIAEGDLSVREELEAEMARLIVTVRDAGGSLYQAMIALEDVGIEVFPPNVKEKSINGYTKNVEAAFAYLGKRGLFGERVRKFHSRPRASRKRRGR